MQLQMEQQRISHASVHSSSRQMKHNCYHSYSTTVSLGSFSFSEPKQSLWLPAFEKHPHSEPQLQHKHCLCLLVEA